MKIFVNDTMGDELIIKFNGDLIPRVGESILYAGESYVVLKVEYCIDSVTHRDDETLIKFVVLTVDNEVE